MKYKKSDNSFPLVWLIIRKFYVSDSKAYSKKEFNVILANVERFGEVRQNLWKKNIEYHQKGFVFYCGGNWIRGSQV